MNLTDQFHKEHKMFENDIDITQKEKTNLEKKLQEFKERL